MSEPIPSPQFEEEIRAVVATPPARDEFIESLQARLMRQAAAQSKGSRPLIFKPVWVTIIVFALLLVAVLVIGPQRVAAAMRSLLGYIPGVGIVDQSAPIRVLVEPVSVSRQGVSITVTSAILTRDKTHVDYRIFGVPGSAYPDREDRMGCTESAYLRLANGIQLSQIDSDFQPIPKNINEAVLVIPCIFNTLPGTVPGNWELLLRFVPAPPDLTIMPVIELSPSPQVSPTMYATMLPTTVPATPTPLESSPVIVSKVIETGDGYILIGWLQPPGQLGEQIQITGTAEIRDASGKKVTYTFPMDVSLDMENAIQGGYGWVVQFKAAGLVYPLTIAFPGVYLRPADPNATAEFTFDAGPNPQPGQEWKPNQAINLAGYSLTLVLVSLDSRNGYSFLFQADPQVYGASVQIVGHTPTGGGGGGGGGLTNGEFNVSLSYDQLPTGLLTISLANLVIIGDPITLQGQWSPTTPRTDLPANPTPQPGLCLTVEALAQLEPLPTILSNGKFLMFEELDGTGNWGLVLYALDGSHRQVVVPDGNWGALSPDGSQVAYSGSDGSIHLMDVESQTDRVLQNASGFDIRWSPDGTQIAYIGMGNGAVNSAFIANVDGTQVRQISSLSYATIIGWTPEGAKLYFAVPFTGGAAWKVYAYDIASGAAQEQFTIENGTPKFLNPKLSPDGDWIAYRGQDNSSLYLVHPDGSDLHLVLDNLGVVGVAWSRTGWLGVSLMEPNSSESRLVVLKPDVCEAYILSASLHGELEGWFIP